MAAVLACGAGAVLSHRSAGQLWGFVPPIGDRAGSDAAHGAVSRGRDRAASARCPADEVDDASTGFR